MSGAAQQALNDVIDGSHVAGAGGCVDDVTTVAMDPCLKERHYYVFMCSSAIAFFTGLLLVLFGRIFVWMFCADTADQIPPPSHPAAKKGSPDAAAAADLDAQIGWVTEAKDWAGELISGQTTTGRILVSKHYSRLSKTIMLILLSHSCYDFMIFLNDVNPMYFID